ncbi:MAG TPA: hypothetical protein VFM05_09300 [Candidatus Saccharimonadales bacterium]|nr:hypothetical protein [Candidatus Saccharimonadales bacterium]
MNFVALGTATEYLRAVVGNEWTNQMVFSQHSTVSRPNQLGRAFMKAEDEETEHRYRNLERTVRLAELLFNLQFIKGIDGRLDDLRRGKVEATYAELEAGAFLLRRSVLFNYVDEIGVKGLDYDGQILLKSGERVICEMKCKVESTGLSEGGSRNALDAARRQLPPGEPGIVFLKIPESWVRDPKVSTVLSTALNDFLRGTSRVIAVVLRWEEVFVQAGEVGALIAYKYRVELGPAPKSVSPEVQNLLDQLSGPAMSAWISFGVIAEEAVLDAV